jgi:signal transduction histidine kinase
MVVVTLVAAVLGAALAAGVFVLVRDARLRDSLDRARSETEFDLRLARSLPQNPAGLQGFVDAYEGRGLRAVLIAAGRTYVAGPTTSVAIPEDLRAIVTQGQLGYERQDVGATPTLIVGGPTPKGDAQLYFFFPETAIGDDLGQLRTALVLGVLAVTVVGFAFGHAASGRIRTLAEAERWQRRFTSDVSHELRTRSAALVSEASVLQENLDRLPSELRRPAELLVADVARLRRLVEDLTSMAQLDAGREVVVSERFDLGALVTGAVRSRGWEDRVQLTTAAVDVVSDRTRVDRIAANLIANAIEHGGGDVTVRVSQREANAFVEVADRGPGIAPEHLGMVFDRFFRGDVARTGPGSGLGLAIARENARLLGGEIEAWSEAGTGSRFTLRLPVAEPLRNGSSPVTSASDDGVT